VVPSFRRLVQCLQGIISSGGGNRCVNRIILIVKIQFCIIRGVDSCVIWMRKRVLVSSIIRGAGVSNSIIRDGLLVKCRCVRGASDDSATTSGGRARGSGISGTTRGVHEIPTVASRFLVCSICEAVWMVRAPCLAQLWRVCR